MSWERIGPPPVEWGLTMCQRRHCTDAAVCLLDGWPLCLDHADEELERTIAWELNPELVGMLPALDDR